MLYPVCAHQDGNGSLGAVILDFLGCFSGADDWRDLPRVVQEAIEVHCEGEDMGMPTPSSLDELCDGPDCEGGKWVFIDVGPNVLNAKGAHQPVPAPAHALRETDAYVQAREDNRSGFMVTAALSVARGELQQ